ncbi:MAG: hypothetical protein HRT93_05935 [Piscirickettsiaceae bacterium]|nr:hypothetical protein [Piscirickettsiaceae bacterium]
MLPQWRKPTLIAITPDSITINSGDKENRVIDTENVSSWAQVLIKLENNAATIKPGSIRFILSNHYVRYAVLPWQPDVFSQQDWQSLAENYMRTLYGNDIDNWTIRIAMQGYGQPLVISAIDQLLLMRLEALAQQYKWTIEAIEPALMSVMNHYHHKIKKHDWLMLAEPQRLLLAEITKGALVRFTVASPTVNQQSVEALNVVKRTMKLQQEMKSRHLHVFGKDTSLAEEEVDMLKASSLSIHNKSDNTSMSEMLATLI